MTVRPILFQAPIVRAMLDGRATQTRRVLKPFFRDLEIVNLAEHGESAQMRSGRHNDPMSWGYPCAEDGADMPIGLWPEFWRFAVGDMLWVREVWSGPYRMTGIPPSDWLPTTVWYWAGGDPDKGDWTKPKPGIHMPRWASRLTLEVTQVRVERLQDISEEDARAAGAYVGKASGRFADDYAAMAVAGAWFATARGWYADLWDRINGRSPGCAWSDNPWIVAVTFAVHAQNVDALLAERNAP